MTRLRERIQRRKEKRQNRRPLRFYGPAFNPETREDLWYFCRMAGGQEHRIVSVDHNLAARRFLRLAHQAGEVQGPGPWHLQVRPNGQDAWHSFIVEVHWCFVFNVAGWPPFNDTGWDGKLQTGGVLLDRKRKEGVGETDDGGAE